MCTASACNFATNRRYSHIVPVAVLLAVCLDESEGGAPVAKGRWLGVESHAWQSSAIQTLDEIGYRHGFGKTWHRFANRYT
jgi:hypothetical protein